MLDFRIQPAGDAALRLELPARFDEAISARVTALGETVRARWGGLVRDAVVGYHTLTVYFDPLVVDGRWLEEQLAAIAADPAAAGDGRGAHIEVPVCYGGDLGPDLGDVAASAGCSEQEVIELHTSRSYRVFVVGFVPGFGYMGPVDPRLSLPRRRTPRTKVPAGSVALAAGQTGIYPMETPGGWHLIGRTPVRPFDESRAEPVLFRPGDRVRFRGITREEYDAMSGTLWRP
jgi:KipI family sensor histidine kinase inhibitor